MNVSDLLPIGSVVLLKDGEKRLMIIGVMQSNDNGSGENYDYLGILYPEGHIGDQFNYLFNQEDIQKVIFRGYEDEERDEFIKKLSSILENENASVF